ncbi:hypothetical protein B0H19DRAFT_234090 [Mycena capillaripes]|nr:hypothetical protein B0H19DRAFT_234090 [Mycena capillaripes]
MHYLGIGLPYNFVHETHVSFNPSTGVITGLPEGGDEVFFNKFVPSEIEPQQSLVIKVPSSKLEYVWRIRSSAEKIQDILKSVCHNMGLQGADNVLALAGDNTPLVGTVADLQGHRELEIITQATDGTAPLQSPSENKIFVRIKIALDADEVHFATTFLVTPQMKIQDLLQLVCSKVKVEVSPHTLKLADGVEPLAMDRTVADLQGKHQLTLIRRDGPLVEDILLRVNLRISPDETFLCSVPATSQMQIYDVLQRICSKMKFKASEYTLAISGSVEPLAMDLTVANLDGKHQLVLVKRASSHGLGADQFQNIFCCHSADIDL